MDPRLHDLLRSIKNEELAPNPQRGETLSYTHFTYFGPKSRWNIPSSKFIDLWRGYCDLVYNGEGSYCLAEKT